MCWSGAKRVYEVNDQRPVPAREPEFQAARDWSTTQRGPALRGRGDATDKHSTHSQRRGGLYGWQEVERNLSESRGSTESM